MIPDKNPPPTARHSFGIYDGPVPAGAAWLQPMQVALLLKLLEMGYVLRYNTEEKYYEVGTVEQRGLHNTYYDEVVTGYETPQEAVEAAGKKLGLI